ncbi:hypothetical protein [Streptomyces sp. H27-D2]|uniref:hypothetical protein n=1 Tax=Streptomyces sp. H27-D2 TaxID=3046304 RepID=UPI002DB943C6|nr:hypothetical protein [Streptomyces sp. H27-D2]MEC4020222.1 hypothetical protein [Streptomyces sp. H27-D2]
MSPEPTNSGNLPGTLSKDDAAMQKTLAALGEHLNGMAEAGRTVRQIKEEVATAYQAKSALTHGRGIDDWIAVHARVTQATQSFHEGTKMANMALDDGEQEADGLALSISNSINP